MRKVLLVTALFSVFISRAQITLIIEDETKSGFKLVVDQYLQNAQASRKLVVENIPTEEHQLTFLMQDSAQTKMTRPLNLLESGHYKYVLNRNFKGELKLHYRGKLSKPPSDYTHEKYNTLIAYVPAVRSAIKAPAEKREETPEKIAVADTVRPEIATRETSNNDSLNTPAAAEKPAPKANPEPVSFATLYEKLAAKAYEFEKLHFAEEQLLSREVSDTQVAQVLEVFKYDQTRMQFLEKALEKQPGLKYSGDLFKPKFEYEISRKKVSELIQ